MRLQIPVLILALIAAACASDGDDGLPLAAESTTTLLAAPTTTTTTIDTTTTAAEPAVALADVTGPIVGDTGPVLPQPATELPMGYVEDEFFLAGEATSYELVGEAGADGVWDARGLEVAPYRTRIIVRRPPADQFSGVVVVEWLNVTTLEASPDWGYLSEEIARSGHAYVAVSAQALGVVGGESLISVEIDSDAAEAAGADAGPVAVGGLVAANPDRYGTLEHPGDAFAFDIFSQVGAALTTSSATLLGGLSPTSVLAAGESQSAGFLTTYLNAIHPLVDTYDGFLVHSRGAGAAPIDGAFGVPTDDEEEAGSFVTDGVRIREDLSAPVFILQSETDLTLLGYTLARQPDTDMIRTWEVAGTAHADAHVFRAIIGGPRNPGLGSFLGCTQLINSGPHHEAAQAVLHHLVSWAGDGQLPPVGERLEIIDVDRVAIARDEMGMALGGVRNPLVDVPVVVVTGDPWGDVSLDSVEDFDICNLFGRTIPIEQAGLVELHGSADEYVAAFERAAADTVEAGFLLAADAEQLLEEAELNRALFD